ncbi:ABC transporter substrate-binding protein [Candidatus Parcubacteria bacterium]|nr:MAG: ABC transporter substrate-binding protein [Candidatus Parcubacteria bacterium]
MSKNTKIILGVAVLALVVVFVMQNSGSNVPGDVVKIGFIGPLSGDIAAYGEEMQKVLKYRLAEVNAQRGTKFEVVYEDGKCSGSDAVSAFQKLTDIDGVKIIIGGGCSSETLGIAPLTKDGKALAVSSISSNPTIEGASPYVFTTSYTDQVIGETLARLMSTFSKIAIISEQNDYNIGIKTVWEKKIAEYPNVKVVANEVFPKGSTDFRNLLAKIRRANPEAILLNPNPGVVAENLLKQLAEVKDWKGYKLYSQIGYLADDTRAAVGDFAEGMTIVDAPNLTDPAFLAYKAKIEEAEGPISNLGNYYTASTIDTVDILTSLIRELGNDQKVVRDALASRTFKGYLGNVYFDGHSFKQGSEGGVYVVEGGKAVQQ